jgi:hypothetical protein
MTDAIDTTSDDDPEERDMERIKRACTLLIEHFDSVQIIATRHAPDEDGTIHASWGEGNWYARYGSVREWLLKKDEASRENVRRDDPGE